MQKGVRFVPELDSVPEEDFDLSGIGSGDVSFNWNLDYIELSALGKASVPLGSPPSRASVYALAGPAVAFNVQCEAGVTGVPLFGDLMVDCGEAEAFKTIDFGVAGGIGVEMALAEKLTLSLDLLYTLGLQSIVDSGTDSNDSDDFDDNSDDLDFGDDVKNRAFTLQVGLASGRLVRASAFPG